MALAEALNRKGSFPSLSDLTVPGKTGTYKTGRGRNVREHSHEIPGEEELRRATQNKGRYIRLMVESGNLEYKIDGAQRRAGFSAQPRRWGPY